MRKKKTTNASVENGATIDPRGARVKELVDALGIKQTRLAEKLGADRSVITRIIKGNYNLSKGMAARIADVTGASEDWLLTGAGSMFDEGGAPSLYTALIDAGASVFAAGCIARYFTLDRAERAAFERVLKTVFALDTVDDDDDGDAHTIDD